MFWSRFVTLKAGIEVSKQKVEDKLRLSFAQLGLALPKTNWKTEITNLQPPNISSIDGNTYLGTCCFRKYQIAKPVICCYSERITVQTQVRFYTSCLLLRPGIRDSRNICIHDHWNRYINHVGIAPAPSFKDASSSFSKRWLQPSRHHSQSKLKAVLTCSISLISFEITSVHLQIPASTSTRAFCLN